LFDVKSLQAAILVAMLGCGHTTHAPPHFPDAPLQLGDDSDREVRLTRALSDVEVIYLPSGTGAGLTVNFRPCKGLNYNTGFGFEEGQDRSRQVSDQIAEGYADFTKDCKAPLTPRADLMQGFPQAFATLEQWLKERPFTYRAEPATDDNKQGQ